MTGRSPPEWKKVRKEGEKYLAFFCMTCVKSVTYRPMFSSDCWGVANYRSNLDTHTHYYLFIVMCQPSRFYHFPATRGLVGRDTDKPPCIVAWQWLCLAKSIWYRLQELLLLKKVAHDPNMVACQPTHKSVWYYYIFEQNTANRKKQQILLLAVTIWKRLDSFPIQHYL